MNVISRFFEVFPTTLEFFVVNAVDAVTSDMVSDMVSSAPTTKIRGAIDSKPAKVDGGRVIGEIRIDLAEAPEALAYEFGSGIHSDTGEKYIIQPKEKQALAFFWDKADPTRHIILPDGRVMFRSVMHPGVQARPYITPAWERTKTQFLSSIRNEIASAIRIALS